MLDIAFANSTSQKDYTLRFFKPILEAACGFLGFQEYPIAVSINIVGRAKIKRLNKTHRGKDALTDVLSFPLLEDAYKHLSPANKKLGDIIDLGDIFVCLDVAAQRAEAAGISLEDELAFLTVHGFLHLLGYDHERSPKAEKEMFAVQDSILQIIRHS